MRTRYPTKLGTLGSYSQGRISDPDRGDLALAIGVDPLHKIVRVDFGTDVCWLGMNAGEAREFAEALLRAAKALEDGN